MPTHRGRRLRAALLALAFLAALVCAVRLGYGVSGAGATAGELVAQPTFGTPAKTFLGASPEEATGEVWATSSAAESLARYTDASGWSTEPVPVTSEGQPVEELEWVDSPDAGRTTANGGVAAVARGPGNGPILVVREPGGPPRVATEPPTEVLGPEEALFEPEAAPPLLATMTATGGALKTLVVPIVQNGSGSPQAVLTYTAGSWAREPICIGTGGGPGCEAPPPEFTVLAIEAGGGEAWLLGKDAEPEEGVELFRRQGSGGSALWRQQSLGPSGSLGALFAEEAPLGTTLAPREVGQPLTVTAAGVWADAQIEAAGTVYPATFYYDIGKGEVTGSWCDLASPAGLCTNPLGAELPSGDGRSFAWPPASGSEPFGQRVITGIGEGAILNLESGTFTRISLAGGSAGTSLGAALAAPDSGWLGATPPLHLTRSPDASRLDPWPVPFRRPLTAIAAAPSGAPAALGTEALAVGADGEVARYVPNQGWEPEFLLTASGKRATPILRGVAWPEPGRAFAVGDGAAMWVWQKATGLWSPDPAQPPDLFRANFTGIAFDPAKPSRGYAIGKQGLLLSYGRTWTPEALPAGVPPEANLTSIAFAGSQAIVTWKYPVLDAKSNAIHYSGGVIVNNGSGWEVDAGASQVFKEGAPPQRVAGLPDGGAVIATAAPTEASIGNGVYERQGPSSPWELVPGGPVGYPAALAAIREGGQVRAIVSVAKEQFGRDLGTDEEQVRNPTPVGQAPLLTDPYPLPGVGLLVRQTATGWRDEEHQAYPLPSGTANQLSYDMPVSPDPVLGLLVSSDGSEGWAVGGETGTFVRFNGEAVQTAGVFRYGASAAPPSNAAEAPIAATPGTANFAIGGGAQCAGPCADLEGTGIGPERWLRSAIGKAAGIAGLRAFLYTGPGVANGLAGSLSGAAFSREEAAYARRLASASPVFAAPAQSDLDGTGTLASFAAAFSGFQQPLGAAPPSPGISPISQAAPGQPYYSFLSAGTGGSVRVIVLDYSGLELGQPQRCWLAGELRRAGAESTPAVVVGQRDLAGQVASGAASDASTVIPIIVAGAWPAECGPAPGGAPTGASAYFFDFPEQDRQYSLVSGGRSMPAYGSGTLGYVTPPKATETDFVGASGFLLASVNVAGRNPTTNVAPVSATLVPNVASLALDATDGTLLRRSKVALFEALARRPVAGGECTGNAAPQGCEVMNPDPYVQIPTECQGARCPTGVFPEYTFSSSEPDIADFVAHDPASTNPRNILLVNEKPVLDPHSGLLCAFNSGTTTVTVSTGGLSYSRQVTVLAGSVARPCGTTPLRNRAAAQPATPPPPPPVSPAPAPAPAPAPPPPPVPAPIPPPPPAPAPPPPAATPPVPNPVAQPSVLPFFNPAQSSPPIVPIVPPPAPPAFQPTPPSGTAPVGATEDEEEEEEAYDSVSAMARVEHPVQPTARTLSAEGGGSLVDLRVVGPGALALAAFALFAAFPRPRPRRGRSRIAYQATESRRYR